MLLVVANNEPVDDLTIIPWDKLEGVMIVNVSMRSHRDLKMRLRDQCRLFFIPLVVRFAVPQLEAAPPRELLIGNGLTISHEVVLYGDLVTEQQAAKNHKQDACGCIPEERRRPTESGTPVTQQEQGNGL